MNTLPMRAVAVVALLVAAYGGPTGAATPGQDLVPGTLVGDLRIGERVDCSPCEVLTPAAIARLDATIPNHAAIVRISYFMDPLPSGAKRSGISTVAVLDLADGTRSAILVYCGVGGCIAG